MFTLTKKCQPPKPQFLLRIALLVSISRYLEAKENAVIDRASTFRTYCTARGKLCDIFRSKRSNQKQSTEQRCSYFYFVSFKRRVCYSRGLGILQHYEIKTKQKNIIAARHCQLDLANFIDLVHLELRWPFQFRHPQSTALS